MAESEEEVNVLVQRVVKDITNAFKRNPNIDEIGVIQCPEARCNRSPIVLVENKLGVESWCVKFLLPYVHNKLLLYRQRKYWLDREALGDITCTLLLLNPDFTTAWNVRKELLQCGVLHPEKDLYLSKLALTRFPKSPETWIHRRWVLQQIQSRKQEQGDAAQVDGERSHQLSDHLARTLHQEMKVCSNAAGRYPSNYNAWSHRIWVLQQMAKGNVKVFHDELSSMRLWVSMHVSDHSGFHLRELITELSKTPAANTITTCPSQCQSVATPSTSPHHHSCARSNGQLSRGDNGTDEEERQLSSTTVLQLFHQEMELCSDLIQSYPGHETLWSHRRHVFYLWHHWKREHQHLSSSDNSSSVNGNRQKVESHGGDGGLPKVNGESCADQVESQKERSPTVEPMDVDVLSLHDSKRLKRGVPLLSITLSSEHSFLDEIMDRCSNPEQRRFALAYEKWLDTVIGQRP
ncbi:protein prenyltransferase alpha subunit repeat-containing protein 1 [Cynoglossus semilaevis]|uniref:Protein prenyltransferase alpha subunit repeat containing 1 n=1 Tax=Cynoglossus semilaevis TaxID=244447 RepID=A0A3P8VKZ6_CYNSE|nr:protein prenyltransferase alpha subunit repeat-containing protein 1 [Cynoglossus semilaevis]